MSPELVGAAGLVAFLFLVFNGMPIAFAFGLVGGLGILLLRGLDPALAQIGSAPYTWASAGSLLPVPLFILMGRFVSESGIGEELFQTAQKWVGRVSGGLAMATILAASGFAACCGTSLAGAAVMASVAFPEMERLSYSRKLSTGAIAAGGTLSPLIPPSVPFIIYGVFTGTSIGKLFIAGILPGLLLAGLYVSTTLVLCWRNPELGPRGVAYSAREMVASLRGLIGAMGLFVVVIGGLFVGIFTPSEAGSIGACGAFVLCLLRRSLNTRTLIAVLKDSVLNTCFILTITIGAMIYSNFLSIAGFGEMFRGWIGAISFSRHVTMVALFFIYIVLGTVMDGLALLLLTLPIVFPVVIELGYDPVWFGVVIVLLIEMALITPPVGLTSYTVSGVTKVPLEGVFEGILPFFIAMVICLMILYLFPSIVLVLPQLAK